MENKEVSPELISNAEALWVGGADPVKIRAELRRNDLDERTIDRIIDEIKFKHGKSKAVTSESKGVNMDLILGGVICLIGVLVTIISLNNGSRGIIAYGAILYGGIRFIKGIMKMTNSD